MSRPYLKLNKEQFIGRVKKTKTCWLWTMKPSSYGYGRVTYRGRTIGAHRMSWILFRGSLKGLDVLHKCDNPPCVKPSHLFLGTQKDNIVDATNKGRMYSRRKSTGRFV